MVLRAGLLALFLLSSVGVATGYGDRSFNANQATSGTGDSVDTTVILFITTTHQAGQSFTPTRTFVLSNVTLYVTNVGAQGDALNVTIQGDVGGLPDGTTIAGGANVRSGTGWLDFPVTPRPTLTAGRAYWIVASNGAAQGYTWIHSNADVVAGQSVQATNGAWGTPTSVDLTYVTYGIPAEPEIAVGLAVDRRSTPPGGPATFTVYLNNSGFRPAPNGWVNLTLPAAMSVVSDNAASVNGTSTGPASWRFGGVRNGPNAFAVTVTVNPAAPGGTFLTTIAHLDYTDSLGASQSSSTASATVLVALKPKPMYLAHDALPVGTWDRLVAAPPTGVLEDFEGDGAAGMTIGSAGANWTLVPAFAKAFWIRGGVTATLFFDAPNPAGSTATVNATLYDRGTSGTAVIASVATTVSVDGNAGTFESRSLDLGIADHLVLRGNITELRVFKVSGADLWLGYNRSDLPSAVVVTTSTYISVDRVDLLDARGIASTFSSQDRVRLQANVSDPFGTGEIASVMGNVTAPDGSAAATQATFLRVAADPGGTWASYEYAYNQPTDSGAWSFLITATEGNGVSVTAAGTFTVAFPVLDLTVTEDPPAPKVDGVATFTVGYANTGTAKAATAWMNVTLPSELVLVSDTTGGLRTGASSWTIPNVDPGFHAFVFVARVAGAPANQTLLVRFALAYSDAKGFGWTAAPRSLELAVVVPPVVPEPPNPFLFLLLGLVAAGGGAAGLWVWRSRKPAIEEAFLIHRAGVLLYHVSRSLAGEGDKDRDILGAMLTAVQEFVKDSFKYGEGQELNKLEFGDFGVLIERGKDVFLAAVLAGTGHEAEIRRQLRRTVDEVEAKFGKVLDGWGGDMDPILGVRDIVRRLVVRRRMTRRE